MKLNTVNIRKLLLDKKLTQKMIAESIPMNRTAFSLMLSRGSTQPSTAIRIATILGVPVEEISQETIPSNSNKPPPYQTKVDEMLSEVNDEDLQYFTKDQIREILHKSKTMAMELKHQAEMIKQMKEQIELLKELNRMKK